MDPIIPARHKLTPELDNAMTSVVSRIINSDTVNDLVYSLDIEEIIHNERMYNLNDRIRQVPVGSSVLSNFNNLIAQLLFRFIMEENDKYTQYLYGFVIDAGPNSQIMMCTLIRTLYDNHQLDLILKHPWIISPRSLLNPNNNFKYFVMASGSFVNSSHYHDRLKFLNDIIQFMIMNHQHLNAKYILGHIAHYFKSSIIEQSDILQIIKLCIEVGMPFLDEFLDYAIDQPYGEQIFDIYLESGLSPSPRSIQTIFLTGRTSVLKLFVKYHVDIKSIIRNCPAHCRDENIALIKETTELLSELDVDLFDYLCAVRLLV